ncbi:MAG: hypothetical protein IKV83_02720 [Muribaculaceae bacterium]|nr:hypothetical protein [Muribaculaceae bacterium]
MKDKSLELMTEEGLKLYEEFTRCQNIEEIDELEKRWDKLNESRENNTIPHYDMTLEELCKRYNLVLFEDVMKKYGIK